MERSKAPTVDVIKKNCSSTGNNRRFFVRRDQRTKCIKDTIMFKRMADIESLPNKDKECLLLTVDNFIKSTKLNAL